ncbi:chitin deacetylase [Mortierella sp. GBA30]|nr:chitin deacetylase [Mortierella sp. GBA30]
MLLSKNKARKRLATVVTGTTVALIGSVVPLLSLITGSIEAVAVVLPGGPKPIIVPHPAGQSPWPLYGQIPETNTPEVKAWVKLVDWSKVPKIPVRATDSPGNPPACPKIDPPQSECWWTCSGCTTPDDVVDCPGKKAWGLTFDDGPEPGTTEKLLTLMSEKNVTATFFVTGMKSAQAPRLLKQTLDKGHHLAIHTWSHSGLTTLKNEEVVAELKWTEKFIFDHTGYKLKYFRPPYGDIDNRVRAIAHQLGFKTVIWSTGWDSQDWQLPYKTITPNQIVNIFKNDLTDIPERQRGVITLEHDGAPQMVAMARTLLDMGIKSGLKPMDIAKCLSDPVGYNAVPAKASVEKSIENTSDQHKIDGTAAATSNSGGNGQVSKDTGVHANSAQTKVLLPWGTASRALLTMGAMAIGVALSV